MKKKIKPRFTVKKLIKHLNQKVEAGNVVYFCEGYVHDDYYFLDVPGKANHTNISSIEEVSLASVVSKLEEGKLRGKDIIGLIA